MGRYVLRRSVGALLVLLVMVTVTWMMVKAATPYPFPPR
jgi:hypothetical protein